jgi:hypothetical protein
MTLDDAIAALEAKLDAKREADAANLAAVDAACRRFAELAAGRQFLDHDTELGDGSGWIIKLPPVRIMVHRDGTWERRYSNITDGAERVPNAVLLETAMAEQIVGSIPEAVEE